MISDDISGPHSYATMNVHGRMRRILIGRVNFTVLRQSRLHPMPRLETLMKGLENTLFAFSYGMQGGLYNSSRNALWSASSSVLLPPHFRGISGKGISRRQRGLSLVLKVECWALEKGTICFFYRSRRTLCKKTATCAK